MKVVARRGFTLIELLVILTIIAMVLVMALPSIVGMIRGSRIGAAADILQAAVSFARSSAISQNRSSTIDLDNTETGEETERVLVSVKVVADDFERHPTDVVALEEHFGERQLWEVHPSLSEDGWLVVTDQTRELRAGYRGGEVKGAYAWNLNTEGPSEPEIDDVSVVQARFRVVRPGSLASPDPWGFGLCANLTRNKRRCVGYRLAVRGKTDEEGYNIFSEIALEKVFNPTNPNKDHAFEAQNPPVGVEYSRSVDIAGQTAILTSGVWYWLKMQAKRRDRLVSVVGKFWVGRAIDEPEEWTLGPAYDAFGGATLPDGTYQDNFPEKPLAGGGCGVWADGAEVSVDDFSVESEKGWALPARILLQAVRMTVDQDLYDYKNPDHLEVVGAYTPGGFPLTWLPDGSAEQNRAILVRITDTTDAKKHIVPIDNTGRVGEL